MRTLVLSLLLLSSCAEPKATAEPKASTGPQSERPAERPANEQPSTEPRATADSDPKSKDLRDAMKRMETSPADVRQAFAGAVLAERSQGRLSEPLRKAFDELQTVPSDMRRLVLMKAFATPEVLLVWKRLCAAGHHAITDMAQLRREEHGRHIATTCKLGDASLVPTEQAAKTDGIALAAALVAAEQLDKSGIERELLQFFVRASPVDQPPP